MNAASESNKGEYEIWELIPASIHRRNEMKVGDVHERFEVVHFGPMGNDKGMGLRGYKFSQPEAETLRAHQAEISGKPLEEFQILRILTERLR